MAAVTSSSAGWGATAFAENNARRAGGRGQWPPPAIFVKVDFGLSFSNESQRQLSFGYSSRPFNDTLIGRLVPGGRQGRRRHQEQSRERSRSAVQLRSGTLVHPAAREYPHPGLQPRSVAPAPVPPGSNWLTENLQRPGLIHTNTAPVISPVEVQRPYPVRSSSLRAVSMPSQAGPSQALMRRKSVIERKPLPPSPSRFRLGEANMPWSSPVMPITSPGPSAYSAISAPSSTWLSPDIPVPRNSFSSPITPTFSPYVVSPILSSPEALTRRSETSRFTDDDDEEEAPEFTTQRRYTDPIETEPITTPRPLPLREDPERTRDLAALQQAMMSIDAVSNEPWAPSEPWDSAAELAHLPRGPRGLGWAVRVEEPAPLATQVPAGPPPGIRQSIGRGHASYQAWSPPPDYGDEGWEPYSFDAWERPQWERSQWEYEDIIGYSGYWNHRRRSST
jgi:hypothetical protein